MIYMQHIEMDLTDAEVKLMINVLKSMRITTEKCPSYDLQMESIDEILRQIKSQQRVIRKVNNEAMHPIHIGGISCGKNNEGHIGGIGGGINGK